MEEGQSPRMRELSSEAGRCLEAEDLGLGRTGEIEGSGGGRVDPKEEDGDEGAGRKRELISRDFDRWCFDDGS